MRDELTRVGLLVVCVFLVTSVFAGVSVGATATASDAQSRTTATQAATQQSVAAQAGTENRSTDQDVMPLTCNNVTGSYANVSEEGPYEIGEQHVVELSSTQDGEPIQMAYIKPKGVEDAPVILKASPYFSDFRDDSIRNCYGLARLTENYIQHGYAVAAVSVRGTGGSGGCMDLFGPNERRDLDQAVTWLGEQDWSNGNVGMIGGSYDGTTPWEVAGMGNPHLKTIVPIAGVPNVHQLMFRNGAPEYRGPVILNALYYGISMGTDSPVSGTKPGTYAARYECPDEYATGTYASTYSGATGEYDPSGYWAARNLKPLVERNYEGSVFLVHGLQDWNVDPSQVYPWLEELERDPDIGHVNAMLGQWGHAYPDSGSLEEPVRRQDWPDILLRWWDRYLKENQSVDVGPRVSVQDSHGEWRNGSDWPPAGATEETFYLAPGETLQRNRPAASGQQVVHVDPTRTRGDDPANPGVDCRGCATFSTQQFADTYRFAGAPTVNVTATPMGPGGHLTAYLYAVNDTHSKRLGWGQVDLRYADGGKKMEPVVPGQSLDVTIPIEPLDAKVPEGHRLTLVVHQGTMSGRMPTSGHPIVVESGPQSTLSLTQFEAPATTGRTVQTGGTRADDGTVFTAGQTNQITLSVTAREGGQVRDVVPSSWRVVNTSDDVARIERDGSVTYVYFAGAASAGEQVSYTYFVEAPNATGPYTFGPAQVGANGEWRDVTGTRDTNYVVGQSTAA